MQPGLMQRFCRTRNTIFGKQHRLFAARPVPVHHGVLPAGKWRSSSQNSVVPSPKRHGHKRIVAAGGTYGIQFVLNPLPALVTVSAHLFLRVTHRVLLYILPRRIARYSRNSSLYFRKLFSAYGARILSTSGTVNPPYCCAAVLRMISPMTSNAVSSVLRLIVPYISHLKSAAQHIRRH